MKNKIIFLSCLVLLSCSSIHSAGILNKLLGGGDKTPSPTSGDGAGAGGSPSKGTGPTLNTNPDHLNNLSEHLKKQQRVNDFNAKPHPPKLGNMQAAAQTARDIAHASNQAIVVSADAVTVSENLLQTAQIANRTVALLKGAPQSPNALPDSPVSDNGTEVRLLTYSAGPGSPAAVSAGAGAAPSATALTHIKNGHYNTLPARLDAAPALQQPLPKDPMTAAVATSANAAKTAAHLENATGNAAKAIKDAAPAAVAASSNFKAFGDALNAASKRAISPSGAFIGAGFTAIFIGIKLYRDGVRKAYFYKAKDEEQKKINREDGERLKKEGLVLIGAGSATLFTVAIAKAIQKRNAPPAA